MSKESEPKFRVGVQSQNQSQSNIILTDPIMDGSQEISSGRQTGSDQPGYITTWRVFCVANR